MSNLQEDDIKRWTAKRKSALVLDIIQGKTTVAEASRQFDLPPAEIEDWVSQAKAGMENALRAKPEDVREQYERQLKELNAAYGEAMLELRARKKTGCPAGQGRELIGRLCMSIGSFSDNPTLRFDRIQFGHVFGYAEMKSAPEGAHSLV
jgi:transposase-like protein